ncbi:MAG: AzlD domain-containing protein [Roseiflexaceae bacterium]|nr:AzlD domain-containing protein [Roseiflexaceae bacterium]
MNIYVTILGMVLVTYAARVAALLLLRGELPAWLNRWLKLVPIAVFTALILPPLLLRELGDARVLALGPALPAGLVGALVAWRWGNLLLTIGAGMLAFWLARLLISG